MNLARVIALLAIALLIAACTGAPAATTAPTQAPGTAAPATGAPASEDPGAGPGEPEQDTLRIVQGSSPDFTQVALTKALENLEARGINATFESVDDTQVATNSVIAGQKDIVVNSLFFGINARKEGIPLKTILVDAQTLDYLLVSVPDVTDVEQIVGGTMGINQPGDLGATVADQCLKFAGVDPEEVEFVQVGGTGARMAALIAGQIDAAPAHAAEALAAAQEGGLNVLVDCGQAIGSFLQTGATVTEDWLEANPSLAQHFVDSYIEALRWAAENKDEYIELSKEVVPDMPDEHRSGAYDVLFNAQLFGVDGGLSQESVDKLVSIGLDAGSIEEPIPDDWWTMDLIDNFVARNGTFEWPESAE